ncbi:MAG: nucleoside hydrolase [Planctomycetaceae bacterium]
MAEKLIIDADPGIGDALAIALALTDPALDVLALTATAGRVAGGQAARNLQCVTAHLDPDLWPRLGICDRPQFPAPSGVDVTPTALLDGETGLGECNVPISELHQKHESPKLLAELVRTHPDQITLLTLGPLTNVELALELYPEFLQQLKALVVLGGSVGAGGDATPAAEFNCLADAEAARNVLTHPGTKTLVPLEVSQQLMLSFDQYQRWEQCGVSRLRQFLAWTLPFALRASRQHLGLEGVRLPGVVALSAVSQPQLFQRESMSVDVELHGELTRGMTVFDRRGISKWQTNIDVLTGVDTQGVLDYMARIIRSAV